MPARSIARRTSFLFGLLLLSGCINVDTHITPTNPQVAESLHGKDCVPNILGIMVGTNTVDAAQRMGLPRNFTNNLQYTNTDSTVRPIRAIRSIILREQYLIAFGQRCLIVKGEP